MNPALRCMLLVFPLVIAGAAAGCGVHEDKVVVKAAVDHSSAKQRHDEFEATAQLLDEKPELVDELYGVMRTHDKTMDRFLACSAADLEDKRLAKEVSTYLAEHPASVETMMSASIVAIEKKPEARAAMNRSLATHAAQTADILTDDPQALALMLKSLLLMTEKKPAARKNFLAAIHEDRQAIAALAKEDKALSRAIAAEVLKEMVKDKPTLEKALAMTGALDTPPELAPSPKAKSAP